MGLVDFMYNDIF